MIGWSARRRRHRPNVGVAPAPFSWRVHVMLYTSYMLLDLCNAVYNESLTLTKSSKNDADVFCNSPWYWNETRQRQSKSVFVDNFVKMISNAESFIWNFFENLVNKADGTVKDFNSVYCNNCLWSSEINQIKSNHLFSGNMAYRKTKHSNTLIITSRQKDRQKKSKLHLQSTG